MYEIQNLTKKYTNFYAVDHVSFLIQDRQKISIQGESGCGKSTLLGLLAGTILPDEGEVKKDGVLLPQEPHLRGISMVFQDSMLWNHMTLKENILFGSPKKRGNERKEQVEKLAETFGLTELLNRYPYQVSGGQARRAAIARALACERDFLLLDEPFSNLDPDWKERTAEGIRLFCDKWAVLLVTHNELEAKMLCEKHFFMENGKLLS